MKCIVKAPAKINLSLDVVGKRTDGYHLLETIMQAIDLYDQISVVSKDNNLKENIISIGTNIPYIPTNERNTAYKAAKLFLSEADINSKTIEIKINKKIPQQAGLAGGSADGAGVLVALNKMFPDKIQKQKLMLLGEQVGADVPFCMTGGTALCEGIGEIITPLTDLPETNILLIKPNFGVSTPWIFKNFEIKNTYKKPNTKEIISAINEGDMKKLFKHAENVLAQITKQKYPIINKIEKDLAENGAYFSMMTGSGTTVYGVFENIKQLENAEKIFEKLSEYKLFELIKTKTVNEGPIVLA